MLKSFKLKNQTIPVPVPIKTLEEAVNWVRKTFAKQDSVLTLLKLDGVEYVLESDSWRKNIPLSDKSTLEVEIDSPKDLAIQTLDAVRELSYGMEKSLKELAVSCWDDVSKKTVKKTLDIEQDLSLLLELIDHLNGIFDFRTADMAPINGLSRLIRSATKKLKLHREMMDWQSVSKILLNRLEPLLKEMVNESEALQINALTLDLSSIGQERQPENFIQRTP